MELELYMELELDQDQDQEQEPASKEQELDRGGWARNSPPSPRSSSSVLHRLGAGWPGRPMPSSTRLRSRPLLLDLPVGGEPGFFFWVVELQLIQRASINWAQVLLLDPPRLRFPSTAPL